jgi:hypothetical protein
MFQTLLAHPYEALHQRHLVYCVRVMSVGCTAMVQPTDITTDTTLQLNKTVFWHSVMDWDSSISIAALYGLDGPRTDPSRGGGDFPQL